MSITFWISLIERVFVVAALVFVLWWIRHSGEDHVRVKDMQAVQKQLAANSQIEAANAQAAQQAQVQHDEDLQDIAARIANQRAPVFMCEPPGPSAVSNHPAPTASPNPGSGGTAAGARVNTSVPIDLRDPINAFEWKFEQALADCRQAIASWPR